MRAGQLQEECVTLQLGHPGSWQSFIPSAMAASRVRSEATLKPPSPWTTTPHW